MNLDLEILQINLDDIIPNRFQPRIAFDEQGLKELSNSIKEHGIIQPLVLRKLGNKYEIIAGERRYKAATMAGLTTVPAVISNIDDNKSAEVALVENIQRRDLTPIEEAKSYKNLLDKGYLTQEQLATKMGLSQPTVANKLRLLNLDEEVQQALLQEKISERHARSLLQLESLDDQRKWLNRIINERLTVRQLDQEIKKYLSEEDEEDVPTVNLTPNIEDIKAHAQDINPEKVEKDINSMMVPDSVMTEFSNSLPSNLGKPIVMEKESKPDFMPESATIPRENNNRFFNFTDDEPANMEMGEIKTTDVFKNNELNIIDDKSLVVNDSINMDKKEQEKIDDEVNPSLNTNPNNRFFTPMFDETLDNPIIASKEEIIIDPMSRIDSLDPKVSETLVESEKMELVDAIKETRNSINILKEKGFDIIIDEIDLENEYQITVKIKK